MNNAEKLLAKAKEVLIAYSINDLMGVDADIMIEEINNYFEKEPVKKNDGMAEKSR